MKKLVGCLALLALLLQGGGAFAQTSDYEIIDSYRKMHQSLLESIKEARDLAQCENLGSDIGDLEADYARHRELLAEGLYPETFAASIAALRRQLENTERRIGLAQANREAAEKIEKITEKTREDAKTIASIQERNAEYVRALDELTLKVRQLSERIERLSSENSGLLEKVAALQRENRKDKESIARLEALTEKLNANIRDRDELIVTMMDSLAGDYTKPELTDGQRKNLFVNVQGGGYVGKIVATIDGNVRYVESAILSPRDVELIAGEQGKLSAKWNEIRSSVGKLYPDEQAGARDVATVDGRLSEWRTRIDEATWNSIRQVFIGQGVDIGPFGTAGEFQSRLLAYIDEQVKNPSRDKHQTFRKRVWDSPVKDQWLPLIPTDQLTGKQRAEIEERIALWDRKISALLVRWVLLGVAGVAVVAVTALWAARRKKAVPPLS